MEINKGVVRLGLEIEVAAWKKNESYKTAVQELMANDFMWDDGNGWADYHTYHCNCDRGGCREVRSGNPIYPKPVVSATYDGSLPMDGAEFITSTIILADEGMSMLRPVWDIIAGKAVWNNTLESRNGGPCSPSIHIHASVTSPGLGDGYSRQDKTDDYMHVLSLFAPELLAVASSAGIKRGLAFRQPLRYATDTAHHGFIQIRKAIPGRMVYIEWRMFEAVYDDWDYLEACGYLAGTVTRGLLSENIFTRLMAAGYNNPYSLEIATMATMEDDTESVLGLVDRRRLAVLAEVCLDEIVDDDYGRALLGNLFEKTERSLG